MASKLPTPKREWALRKAHSLPDSGLSAYVGKVITPAGNVPACGSVDQD